MYGNVAADKDFVQTSFYVSNARNANGVPYIRYPLIFGVEFSRESASFMKNSFTDTDP